MAVNYNILVDVDFDVKKTQKKLDSALKGVKGLKVNIGAGKAAKEMRDLDKSAADTLLTFQAANSVFRKSIDIIESMVDQVFKLDSAMIEFQKVSDLSGKALDKYIDKLYVMGNAVARTGTEMLEASTEFRKNGFNDEDAAQLGQIASMYQNVSDEAISAGESANFIISQMVAFGIEAENAEHIIDAVNETANRFAVSSGQIANSLGIVASTSSAMGNSLESTIGMMVSITEQTKNATKAARGLNSIFSALSQVLDESSSNGKKISAIFESLGIIMYDTQGQLRSSYDLLSDMAKVWKTLDKNTQTYIATTIAGTNQLNNYLALMNNFDHAIEATNTALNSAGSAAKENERYLSGLQAKLQAVKASFEQLSASVLDSGLVKGVLDLANAFLKLLNTPVGEFVTQMTLLTGLLWGANGVLSAGKYLTGFFAKMGAGLALTGPQFALIAAGIAAVIAVAPKFVDWFKRMTDEVYQSEEALEEYNSKLSDNKKRLDELNSVPIKNRTEAMQDEIEALEESNRLLQEKIDKEKEDIRLAEYKKTISGTKESPDVFVQRGPTLTGAGEGEIIQDEEFNPLMAQSAEEALRKLEELGYATHEAVVEALNATNQDASRALQELGYKLGSVTLPVKDSYELIMKQISAMTQQYLGGAEIDADFIGSYLELKDALDELKNSSEGLSSDELPDWVENVLEKFEILPDITKEVADEYYNFGETILNLNSGLEINQLQYDQLLEKYPQLASALSATANGYKANTSELKTVLAEMSNVTGASDELMEAQAKLIQGQGISAAQMRQLIDLAPALITMTHKRGDAYYLEVEALAADAAAGAQWARDMIGNYSATTRESVASTKARIKNIEAEIRAFMQTKAPSMSMAEWGPKLTELQGQLLRAQRELEALESYSPNYGGISGSSGGGGGSSQETDPIAEQNKLFKEQIALLEHRLHLMEKEGASEEDRIKYLKLMQAEIEKQKKWFYEHGLNQNSKYIQELEKQWWDYEDQIKGLYKDQADIYEMLFGAVADKAQSEIDALEKEKDAIREQNDELERQIRLQEALDALARAKQNKILVYKDGVPQYVEDADAVAKAQQAVDEAKREQDVDQQIADIDKQIDKWQDMKDQWSSVVGDYQKQQDLLLLEQKLGIKLEGENWEERLGNLQQYVDEYNRLMAQAGGLVPESSAMATSVAIPNASPVALASVGAPSAPSTWNVGAPTPASMMANVGGLEALTRSIAITIQNFNPSLPNVTDGEGFVNYLRNNFLQQTLQFAKA